jgi:hypothetical protein
MRYRETSTVSAYSGLGSSGGGGAHFAAAVRHARSPGPVCSLWLTDGSLNREYSILIPQIASPPVIRDKNRMR